MEENHISHPFQFGILSSNIESINGFILAKNVNINVEKNRSEIRQMSKRCIVELTYFLRNGVKASDTICAVVKKN